jgi:hypothetical protein
VPGGKHYLLLCGKHFFDHGGGQNRICPAIERGRIGRGDAGLGDIVQRSKAATELLSLDTASAQVRMVSRNGPRLAIF